MNEQEIFRKLSADIAVKVIELQTLIKLRDEIIKSQTLTPKETKPNTKK